MILEDGTGTGAKAEVSQDNKLSVNAMISSRAAFASRDHGQAWTIVAEDANPTAGEYKAWIQNDSVDDLVISKILTFAVGAATSWKLWRVTGVGATASAIVPVSTNTSVLATAEMTVKGGAGDVTGLTVASVAPLAFWGNGPAYSTVPIDLGDSVRLGTGQAIAVEVDASTDALVAVTTLCYYD